MSGSVKLADLISANPSFEQQMLDWQARRHRKGKDPLDWQALRRAQASIGAPDPGDAPPTEFFAFADPARARGGRSAARLAAAGTAAGYALTAAEVEGIARAGRIK